MISNAPNPPLGFSGFSTTGNNPASAMTIPAGTYFQMVITNTGTNPGFWSIDNGASWHFFTGGSVANPGGWFGPLSAASTFYVIPATVQLLIVPATGGANVTGLYVDLF